MENLTTQVCEACRADAPLLTQEEITRLMPQVQDWKLKTDDNIQKLTRTFLTKNYAQSLALTNAVAALAEEANHHPLIILEYGAVTVEWWSHKIKGLHKNDFIMAAKTSELFV
ncbi:MAG TPA: 4a-hydroxytetrahydrobiopterin dehydratase [Sulfurovum sp.]|nr:4a-hydroxytetrahydrobiopterin dehydratase [Sulfurovum sp.]